MYPVLSPVAGYSAWSRSDYGSGLLKIQAMEEIKELFKQLHEKRQQLTTWQLRFVESLQKQYRKTKELSGKQLAILRDLARYNIK